MRSPSLQLHFCCNCCYTFDLTRLIMFRQNIYGIDFNIILTVGYQDIPCFLFVLDRYHGIVFFYERSTIL